MKTLYLECNMGAAGDMLASALLELHPDPAGVLARLNAAGIPGVEFHAASAVKCGVTGTHFSVKIHGVEEEHHHEHHHEHEHEHEHEHHHHHHHEHHGLHDIEAVISALALPEAVKADAMAVYRLIAEAESHVHGETVEQIHFHEVGSMDAVADVSAVCLLLHELSPDKIVASPVHTGSGQVRCAHGILPVPAPATAWLLRGLPSYGGAVRGELCTPTGAALLRHFVPEQSFGPQPALRVEKVGYGMGMKDFEQANCVRAMWGETDGARDSVVELVCNLDDMTPEEIGFATERLLEAGALDVFTTAVGMKKNRPGVLLTVLCREEQREEMARLLFLHTTTLGVRESVCKRYVLDRATETAESAYGPVRIKTVSGWGVTRKKAEYEDLAKIARENGVSLRQAAGQGVDISPNM